MKWYAIAILITIGGGLLGISLNTPKALEYGERSSTYIDNGVLRIGVNLDWGGALSELWYNGINLIDNHDTGRLVQISLYDGDEYYNYTDCTDPNWGWNPVQGGDKYNHGSPVIKYYNRGYEIYVKVRPYEWNPDNKGGDSNTPVLSDVLIEQWVSFGPKPNIIKIKYRVTSLSAKFHKLCSQEFPCIYTNSALNHLVLYNSSSPWSNDTLSVYNLPIHPQPPLITTSTEYWAALMSEDGTALGIYSKNLYSQFLALGFPSSANTCYFRGERQFSIHSDGVIEDEIYLVVGNINDVRKDIYNLHKNYSCSLRWNFDNTDNWNEMWYPANNISDFRIENGCAVMNSTGTDPFIILMHDLGINASKYTEIEIKMYVENEGTGAIYFTTVGDTYFDESKKIAFQLQPGTFATYRLNMSSVNSWRGIIGTLRFDPTTSMGSIKIDYIKFSVNEPIKYIPIYRLWSSAKGDHLYTTDSVEKYWAQQFGYSYEGIIGYVLDRKVANSVPLYYIYISDNDDSFYTASDSERKNAMSNGAAYIGILGYVYLNDTQNTIPVYRLYNPDIGDHFYTTDWSEAENANQTLGYIYEGIAFYVFPSQTVEEVRVPLLLIIAVVFTVSTNLKYQKRHILRHD